MNDADQPELFYRGASGSSQPPRSFAKASLPVTTSMAMSTTPIPLKAAAGSLPGTDGRSGKPVRKRPRASKKSPTTLLSTDTLNFRAMVQQFTGVSSTPHSSYISGDGMRPLIHKAGTENSTRLPELVTRFNFQPQQQQQHQQLRYPLPRQHEYHPVPLQGEMNDFPATGRMEDDLLHGLEINRREVHGLEYPDAGFFLDGHAGQSAAGEASPGLSQPEDSQGGGYFF